MTNSIKITVMTNGCAIVSMLAVASCVLSKSRWLERSTVVYNITSDIFPIAAYCIVVPVCAIFYKRLDARHRRDLEFALITLTVLVANIVAATMYYHL